MINAPDFTNLNVAVIGDILLDEYYDCFVDRVSPEAPVLIARTNNALYTASIGGAGNTALNCKRLGANVFLYGVVGYDHFGHKIKQICSEEDINDRICFSHKDINTIRKVRYRSSGQSIIRIDYEDRTLYNMETSAYDYLLNVIKDNLPKTDVVILSDYAKGILNLTLCKNIILECNKNSIPVFVDPKGDDWFKYKNATCITPNLKEFKSIVNDDLLTDDAFRYYGLETIEKFNLDSLLVTEGKRGIYYISENQSFNTAADAEEVFDVSGAGDTVIAIFAMCAIKSYTDKEYTTKASIKLANIAAGIAIKKTGTYAVSIDELENELNTRGIIKNTKVLTKKEITDLSYKWKKEGKKVVFTNGCFDILHSGHIHLINESSKLGDKLIVAINSDESIKRIKGNNRPIINQYQRAAVISNIVGVDAVIIFNEDDPVKLIKDILPNILVKGGDYTVDTVVGADIVLNTGGTIEIVSLLSGVSTTNIIETIKEKNND